MADTYEVTREVVIDAAPSAVYSHLVDFHNWQAWSPWEGMDPTQTRTYTGPTSGAGSAYAWVGNRKVGAGSMLVTEAVEAERVSIDLHFIKPFKSSNVTTFHLAPEGAGTRVRWVMNGELTTMTKLMSIFKKMDALVGPDFERGLANLKRVVET